jgi:cytochrome b
VIEQAGRTFRTRIWDVPIRIVHWSIVALLPALWWTAENGQLGRHMLLGTVLLGLVAFRILWGFFGSSTARFASFLRGPAVVLGYLSRHGDNSAPIVGHNPAGGWSAAALLGLLSLQVTLGLFAGDVDDGVTGPLNHLIGSGAADTATKIHGKVFYLILAFAAVHVGAIVFYLVIKRENLVGPMITGYRRFAVVVTEPQFRSAWRTVLCAAVAAVLAWWLWNGAYLPAGA